MSQVCEDEELEDAERGEDAEESAARAGAAGGGEGPDDGWSLTLVHRGERWERVRLGRAWEGSAGGPACDRVIQSRQGVR